jgi:hypothetical protein
MQDIVSFEVPISSDCPTGDLNGLSSSGGLRRTRDGPSPTSVLDVSFEDSNINDSESLRNITCSNGSKSYIFLTCDYARHLILNHTLHKYKKL